MAHRKGHVCLFSLNFNHSPAFPQRELKSSESERNIGRESAKGFSNIAQVSSSKLSRSSLAEKPSNSEER